jgi:hypothetical protein
MGLVVPTRVQGVQGPSIRRAQPAFPFCDRSGLITSEARIRGKLATECAAVNRRLLEWNGTLDPIGDELPCLSTDVFLDLAPSFRAMIPIPHVAGEDTMDPIALGVTVEPGSHIGHHSQSPFIGGAASVHDPAGHVDRQPSRPRQFLAFHRQPVCQRGETATAGSDVREPRTRRTGTVAGELSLTRRQQPGRVYPEPGGEHHDSLQAGARMHSEGIVQRLLGEPEAAASLFRDTPCSSASALTLYATTEA